MTHSADQKRKKEEAEAESKNHHKRNLLGQIVESVGRPIFAAMDAVGNRPKEKTYESMRKEFMKNKK